MWDIWENSGKTTSQGVSWDNVHLGRGKFDWSLFDKFVAQAKQHSYRLIYTNGYALLNWRAFGIASWR